MALSSTFPFLTLPPELRLQVYTYLLCPPTPGQSLTIHYSCRDPPATLNIHPAILRTNKKIHDEALPLLHSNTYSFNFMTPIELEAFLDYSSGLFAPVTDEPSPVEDMKLPWTEGRVDQDTLKALKNIEIRTSLYSARAIDRFNPQVLWSETGMLLKGFLDHLVGRFRDECWASASQRRRLVFRIVIYGYEDMNFFLREGGGDDDGVGGGTLLEAVRGARVDRIAVDASLKGDPEGRSRVTDWVLCQLMKDTLFAVPGREG